MNTDDQGKKLRAECKSLFRQLAGLGVGAEEVILFLEQKDQIAELTGSDFLSNIKKLEQKDQIAELTGSNFLSNIKKSEEPFILQAAKDTDFNIYVEQEAFDCLGRIVEGYVGVYTRDIYKTHEPFWDRFESLRRANGNV